MSKVVTLFVLCILMVGVAFALSVTGELDSDVILQEYRNNVTLTIFAFDAEPGLYNVYTLSDVYLLPADNFEVSSARFNKSFQVVPYERLMDFEGSYIVSFFLQKRNTNKANYQVKLNILSVADILAVDTDVLSLDKDSVIVNVRNKYNVATPNVTAHFSSILFDFDKTFHLEPYENISFTVPIDNEKLRTIKAGTYLVDVAITTPKGVASTLGVLRLSEEDGVTTQEDEAGFIIRTSIVNKINSGNVDSDVRVSITRNIFTRFFTSFNEEPISEVRDGLVITYYWDKKIGPSEVFTVKAHTNYLYPLLLVVVLVIFFFALRRVLASKMVIEKSVTPIKTKNGEFALRVYVTVKAKRDLEDVVLIDRIPKTVKIYRKFGASIPDEIDATNRRLKWNLGSMQAGENRTFSYIVYSRVGYVGRFVLPSAAARFLSFEKVYQIASNSVYFLATQSDGINE